jgi:hypothetical protein
MSPVGRPEIGTPINLRLGDELLAAIDAKAKRQGMSRAALIRLLLEDHLADEDVGVRRVEWHINEFDCGRWYEVIRREIHGPNLIGGSTSRQEAWHIAESDRARVLLSDPAAIEVQPLEYRSQP